MHPLAQRGITLTAALLLGAIASGSSARIAAAQTPVILPGPSGKALVKFEVSVPAAVRREPITGRVFVIISRDSSREPRTLVGRVGTPLFGHDVQNLAAGTAAVVDGNEIGTPVFDMADIPAGDYWIQPVVSIYSEFKRADGHVLWMHDDQWEGQNWTRSPGHL